MNSKMVYKDYWDKFEKIGVNEKRYTHLIEQCDYINNKSGKKEYILEFHFPFILRECGVAGKQLIAHPFEFEILYEAYILINDQYYYYKVKDLEERLYKLEERSTQKGDV